jgi:two-component system chemotaxis sensor kinase CheA
MADDLMQVLKATFREEAVDLFEELGSSLLALDSEPRNTDALNRVFRAMHTIKGSGATAGFEQMSRFAHRVEDVYNQAREGRVLVTTELVDNTLLACDTLKLMLDCCEKDVAGLDAQAASIFTALAASCVKADAGAGSVPDAGRQASPATASFCITFRPKPEYLNAGIEPALFLEELRQLGELEMAGVAAHSNAEQNTAQSADVWSTATLITSRPLSQIQNVVESIRQDGHVEIKPAEPASPVEAASQNAGAPHSGGSEEKAKLFTATAWQCLESIESCRALVAAGDHEVRTWRSYIRSIRTLKSASEYLGKSELAQSLAAQLILLEKIVEDDGQCTAADLSTLTSEHQKVRESLDRRAAAAAAPEAEVGPASDKHGAAPASQTIRIDQVKLDRLMRAVGELLVARGAFPTIARKLSNEHHLNGVAKELNDAGNCVDRIADELQSTTMSMRMLPIKGVLQRFPRLIRDMSRSLGKNIAFVIEGEETELDKTVIERMSDPLVHLVRNSADHGIEMPEERKDKGKPAEGTIKVKAFNEGSQIVLQIIDDGKGLDPAFIRRKAVEKGVITAEVADALNSEQSFELIFAPGFSTAEKVTDLSGRGVGMDVVRSNVRSLNGTIEIASQIGKGTVLTIRLPTSLIVSKGILFRAGDEDYIIPMDCLVDMTKVPRSAIHECQGQRLAHVRGKVYPLITMTELLGTSSSGGGAVDSMQEIPIAIVQSAESCYGIIVDRFIDQVAVIMKPLTGGLCDLSLFSGVTIMGDGRIVLVVNPAEVSRYVERAA